MYQQVAQAPNLRSKGSCGTLAAPHTLPVFQVLVQQPPQGTHTPCI